MLSSLTGATLGVGFLMVKASLAYPQRRPIPYCCQIFRRRISHNPNGSSFNTAMMCDATGRHLVTMLHRKIHLSMELGLLSRGKNDKVSPWLEAFVNARKWIEAVEI